MLDDFKTELKRLGMKRIQKEELRRNSTALVLDDKDEDEEVEFADALDTRARPANSDSLKSGRSPDGRLRQNSMTHSTARRGAPRSQTGRGGTKISHLPVLKGMSFGKKKKAKANDMQDLEKQDSPAPLNRTDDTSSSQDRVNDTKDSLGALDFHTKPAGL